MSTATVPLVETSDVDEIVAVLQWRFHRLAESGYGLEQSAVLATHPGIDVQEAIGLLAQGCPPETAVRILV